MVARPAFIPAGTRALTFATDEGFRATGAGRLVLGFVAGATVPFQVEFRQALNGPRSEPLIEIVPGGSRYLAGDNPVLVATEPPYTNRSTATGQAEDANVLLPAWEVKAPTTPPAFARLRLRYETACLGPAESRLGGIPPNPDGRYYNLEPPSGPDSPRLDRVGTLRCPVNGGGAHKTVAMTLDSIGYRDARPAAFAFVYDPLRIMHDLRIHFGP